MEMMVKMAIADRSNKQQLSSVRKSAEEECVMKASGTIISYSDYETERAIRQALSLHQNDERRCQLHIHSECNIHSQRQGLQSLKNNLSHSQKLPPVISMAWTMWWNLKLSVLPLGGFELTSGLNLGSSLARSITVGQLLNLFMFQFPYL